MKCVKVFGIFDNKIKVIKSTEQTFDLVLYFFSPE